MKNLLLVLCLFAASSLIAQQSENRNIGNFTKIHASGSFNLVLEKGNDTRVKLVMDQEYMDRVVTEVDGNVLKIYEKNNRKWNWKSGKKTIYVTYERLEALRQTGSGNIVAKDPIKSRDFELTNSGSGNIHLTRLDVEHLYTKLSGSSNLELGGETEGQEIVLSGSGNIDAMELDAEITEVKISGSGNVKVAADAVLSAHVSGSGNIYYRGNPDKSYTKVSGSGKIRKVN